MSTEEEGKAPASSSVPSPSPDNADFPEGDGTGFNYHRAVIMYRDADFSLEDCRVSKGLREMLALRFKWCFWPESIEASGSLQAKSIYSTNGSAKANKAAGLENPSESQCGGSEEGTGSDDNSSSSSSNDPCWEQVAFSMSKAQGIFKLMDNRDGNMDARPPLVRIPGQYDDFSADLTRLWSFTKSPPPNTIGHKRLALLQQKYTMYRLLNHELETRVSKKDDIDFFRAPKVDNHLHLDASMTPNHLLTFILKRLQEAEDRELSRQNAGEAKEMDPEPFVWWCSCGVKQVSNEECQEAEGHRKPLALLQLFDHLGLSPMPGSEGQDPDVRWRHLTLDALDVNDHQRMSHRFDHFNASYNPFGHEELRAVFLSTKTPNTSGELFAKLCIEVFERTRTQPGNVHLEPRLTVFGHYASEWEDLADWAVDYGVLDAAKKANRVHFQVQVPRLYSLWRSKGAIESFGDMLDNTFRPMFEATANPKAHPKLAKLLSCIGGFDSVDDESGHDVLVVRPRPVASAHAGFSAIHVPPFDWTSPDSPPYSYWIYYTAMNLYVFNKFREARGLNVFLLRPHAGEAGPDHHLGTTFLLANSINHGINLAHQPCLQYLYYLAKIPLAMSPLSNNVLFVKLNRSPVADFFQRGLAVTLSTDDPLLLSSTQEPLIEEYTVAKHQWSWTATEMSEMARVSVLSSAFSHDQKKQLLGNWYFLGDRGNQLSYNNVPDCRLNFRTESYVSEVTYIWRSLRQLHTHRDLVSLDLEREIKIEDTQWVCKCAYALREFEVTCQIQASTNEQEQPMANVEDDACECDESCHYCHIQGVITKKIQTAEESAAFSAWNHIETWKSLVTSHPGHRLLWVASMEYNVPRGGDGVISRPGVLSFRKGCTVMVLRKGKKGMWQGRDDNGRLGWFAARMGRFVCVGNKK